jgi:hypothetical protein
VNGIYGIREGAEKSARNYRFYCKGESMEKFREESTRRRKRMKEDKNKKET